MKKIFNHIPPLIGLMLVFAAYVVNQTPFLAQFSLKLPLASTSDFKWTINPHKIYDGDTLILTSNHQELKVRLCGIDAPELDQPLGIEARDYLRSLIAEAEGEIYVQTIEPNQSKTTLAELWILVKPNLEQQIHLNTAMVEAGYAWYSPQYSNNCQSAENIAWAENNAREDKLGIWHSSEQPPIKLKSLVPHDY